MNINKWVSKPLLPFPSSCYKENMASWALSLHRPLNALEVCVCILLTVLKFQTRLKESLFLRLILLSSRAGGNPTDCSIYITEPHKHTWKPSQSLSHTHTRAQTLTELLRELSRAGNSCRQLTWMEPYLSRSVTHSHTHTHTHTQTHRHTHLRISLNYLLKFSKYTESHGEHTNSLLLHYVPLPLLLTHSSTHLADRLTRKFHSLADTHTHTHTHTHSLTYTALFP